MYIYPYKANSGSAKRLAETLGVKRLKREGKQIHVATLLNWGCSAINREILYEEILNDPEAVRKASNKLRTFKCLDGYVGIPEWTEEPLEASRWLDEGDTVVCRTLLQANSGKGIVVADAPGKLVEAPLYTKYARQEQEYRVHVFNGKVIFQQRKARKKDVPDEKVNWKIRNHNNGFIFAFKNVEVPQIVIDASLHAVDRLGLDFGAVDVAIGRDGKVYVFEVNTAPGIENTCLESYVEALKGYV